MEMGAQKAGTKAGVTQGSEAEVAAGEEEVLGGVTA